MAKVRRAAALVGPDHRIPCELSLRSGDRVAPFRESIGEGDLGLEAHPFNAGAIRLCVAEPQAPETCVPFPRARVCSRLPRPASVGRSRSSA
jgi:hypothetical protein